MSAGTLSVREGRRGLWALVVATLAILALAGLARPAEAAHYIGGQGQVELEMNGDGTIRALFTQYHNHDTTYGSAEGQFADQLSLLADDRSIERDQGDAGFELGDWTIDEGGEDGILEPRIVTQEVFIDPEGLDEGRYVVYMVGAGARTSGIENEDIDGGQFTVEGTFSIDEFGDVHLPPSLDSELLTVFACDGEYSQNLNASDPAGLDMSYDLNLDASPSGDNPSFGASRIGEMTVDGAGQLTIPAGTVKRSDGTSDCEVGDLYVFKVVAENDRGDYTEREIMLTAVDGDQPEFTDLGVLELDGVPFGSVIDDVAEYELAVDGAGEEGVYFRVSGSDAVTGDGGWVSIHQDDTDPSTAVLRLAPTQAHVQEAPHGFNVEVQDNASGLTASRNAQVVVLGAPQVADHLTIDGPGETSLNESRTLDVVLRDADGVRVTTGDVIAPTVTLSTSDPGSFQDRGEIDGFEGPLELAHGFASVEVTGTAHGPLVLEVEETDESLTGTREMLVPREPHAIELTGSGSDLPAGQTRPMHVTIVDDNSDVVALGDGSTIELDVSVDGDGSLQGVPETVTTRNGHALLEVTGDGAGQVTVTVSSDDGLADGTLQFDVASATAPPEFSDLGDLAYQGEPVNVVAGTSREFPITFGSAVDSVSIDGDAWGSIDPAADTDTTTVEFAPDGVETGELYTFVLEAEEDGETVSHVVSVRVLAAEQTADHVDIDAPAEMEAGSEDALALTLRDEHGLRVTTGDDAAEVALTVGGSGTVTLVGGDPLPTTVDLVAGYTDMGIEAHGAGDGPVTLDVEAAGVTGSHVIVVTRTPDGLAIVGSAKAMAVGEQRVVEFAVVDGDKTVVPFGSAAEQELSIEVTGDGSISGLPSSVTTSSGTARRTITAQDGDEVTITIDHDSFGDATLTFPIEDVAAGAAPTIVELDGLEFQGDPIAATRDQAMTFALEAEAGDGRGLADPAFDVDPDLDLVTLVDKSDGTAEITIEATDGHVVGGTYSFVVEVTDDGDPAPALTTAYLVVVQVYAGEQVPDHITFEGLPEEIDVGDDASATLVLRDEDGVRVTTGDDADSDLSLSVVDGAGVLDVPAQVSLSTGFGIAEISSLAHGEATLMASLPSEGIHSSERSVIATLEPTAVVIDASTSSLAPGDSRDLVFGLETEDGTTVRHGSPAARTLSLEASGEGVIDGLPSTLPLVDGVGASTVTGVELGEVEVVASSDALEEGAITFEVAEARSSGPSEPEGRAEVPTEESDETGEPARTTVSTSEGDVDFSFVNPRHSDDDSAPSAVSVMPVDDEGEEWTRGLTMLGQRFALTTENLDFDEVEVCIPIDSAAFAGHGRPDDRLRLIHTPSADVERDITTTLDLDSDPARVCGTTTHFSEFQVAVYAADRLWDDDRYGTAAAAAAELYPDGVDRVYLASGERHPDGLVGGVAASMGDAPLLLTRHGQVPAATVAALDALSPAEVVIVGGEAAVSAAVAAEVGTVTGAQVSRVAGQDRYATAAAVAGVLFGDGAEVVYLATGETFPDALTGGAAALADDAAVLLTRSGSLPDATAEALAALDPDRVVVVGGGEAIAEGVVDEVAAHAGEVVRAAGADRYETAVAVAEHAGFDGETIVAATGADFADALVGSTVAGRHDAPVMLVAPDAVPGVVIEALEGYEPGRMFVLGGHAAIGAQSELTLTRLLPPFVPERL